MKIDRYFTRPDEDPYKGVVFRVETTEDWVEYTVPQHWARASVDILIQQVFFKDPLPALVRPAEEAGIPGWLQSSVADDVALDAISAEWRHRFERDVRQVIDRVVGSATALAFKAGYFDGEADARNFYDELRYMMIHQIALPEVSLLATAGLVWAYGIVEKTYLPRQQAGMGGDVLVIGHLDDAATILRRLDIEVQQGQVHNFSAVMPVDHVAAGDFVDLKQRMAIDRTAKQVGHRVLKSALNDVVDACDRASLRGYDPRCNRALGASVAHARSIGVEEHDIASAIDAARQGYESALLPDTAGEDDEIAASAFTPVLAVTDKFIEAAMTGHSIMAYDAGRPVRHVNAEGLFEKTLRSLWATSSPVIFFTDRAAAAVPSASGGFISGKTAAAPSGAVNLLKLSDNPAGIHHAARMMSVFLALYAKNDAISLSMTNLSAALMSSGIPYDSAAGCATGGLYAALVTAAATAASAEMNLSPAGEDKNLLQVIKEKRQLLSPRALIARGMPDFSRACSDVLLEKARSAWEEAYALARVRGVRHGHLTTVDSGLVLNTLLGAQTIDADPETALSRFEGYYADAFDSAALYGKKLNPSVPLALSRLGYGPTEMDDIYFYVVGHGTLFDAPAINHASLKKCGFHQAALDALEAALKTTQHIRYVFNKWTLGNDFCLHMLGFSEDDLVRGDFDMLTALGFSEDDIEDANLYCCGAMTLEGAPHLKPDHLPVFDCAAPPSVSSIRRVNPAGRIRMQAAIEAFISGAVVQDVVFESSVAIDDLRQAFLSGWELGVRRLSLCRLPPVLLLAPAKQIVEPVVAESTAAGEPRRRVVAGV